MEMCKRTLLLLALLSVLNKALSQDCETGWTSFNYRCYRAFELNKNWYEAQQACQAEGGDLAMVKSVDIQNFLETLIVSDKYWIGLHDTSLEGDFTWVDGIPLTEDVANWNAGEPNNSGEEDCVEMMSTGMWNDHKCDVNLAPYMCEKAPVISPCDESNGWFSAYGMCYKYFDGDSYGRTFGNANYFCTRLNGRLITITGSDVQTVATAASLAGADSFWIGLTNQYSDDANVYKWRTGDVATYTYWAQGEPYNRFYGNEGDCVEIQDTSAAGEWTTAPCDEAKGFMCERDEGTCAPGWRMFKGYCYQVNTHSQVSWTDAKHTCEAQGGYLTNIFSGEENAFIVLQFEDLQNIGITDFWIGISDFVTDGSFVWSDGSAVTYMNWESGNPDDSDVDNVEDCGMIYTGDTSGKWMVSNCYVLKSYVCKIRADQPVQAISPNIPVGECPNGWTLFGDFCYYSSLDGKNFNDAQQDCVSRGSNLVSISDGDEQSFISMRLSLLGTNIWIGLHDTSDVGNFEWLDGSPYSFTNWYAQNPNNYADPGEICVNSIAREHDEGKWNDISCTNTNAYICKRDKECETYTSASTDNDYYYRYHPSPLETDRVEFKVKADNDVHIALTSSNTGQGQLYEIVIGGWGNSQSVIRRCQQCANEVEVSTPGIVSSSEFRGFWITYNDDGKIRVGEDSDVVNPFMEWTDPSPFVVNYIGYSTGFGSSGEFQFCDLTAGSDGTTPNGMPTPMFNERCGLGWEYDSMTQNCYLFRPTDYKSWGDARVQCLKEGGDLLSILSLEEMTYVNARMVYITESSLWIGATDANREGGWMWSNNDPFKYLNWNSGEPNNVGDGGEHCAEMYTSTGTWNDIVCDRSFGYICKKNGYLTSHFSVTPYYYIEDNDNTVLTNVYPEDCAAACVGETDFTCRSFDYNKDFMVCSLSEASTVFNGATLTFDEATDYYERPVGDQCMPGWVFNEGKCYLFNKEAGLTWHDSRTLCQSYGGDLIIIDTAALNNWLTVQVVSLEGSYWIGLHDLGGENDFVWVDGTMLYETEVARWNVGEPNDYGSGEDCVLIYTSGLWNDQGCDTKTGYICQANAGQPDNYGQGEDCVEVYTSGLWNDQNCNDSNTGYICQMQAEFDVPYEPIPTTLPDDFGCEYGWSSYGSACYKLQMNMMTWSEAQAGCEAMDANLASIKDAAENSYVESLLTLSGLTGRDQKLWIGLNDLRLTLTFEWSDGTPVTYTYWALNQPDNNLGAEEDCCDIRAGGGWHDSTCALRVASVCKKMKQQITGTVPMVTEAGCPAGWYAYAGSCYTKMGLVALPWNQAETQCANEGGHLVSINDRYEQSIVTSLLSMNDDGDVWIGLNDRGVSNEYQWSDNTAVTFTNWDYGEPQQRNGNCVIAGSGTMAGLWSVTECTSRYKFLCEKVRDGYTAMPTIAPPQNPTVPNDNDCADGWIGYGNKCFLVNYVGVDTRNKRPWPLARAQCVAMGGDLASFHSNAEEAYIKSRVQERQEGFWIGLHDRSVEAGFEWSDQSVVDYVNWDDDEPNNLGRIGENCVEMYFRDKGWNDNECTILKSWVCQIEKGKVPGTTPVPPITLPPYTPCPGQNDWVLNGDYCYYFSAGANRRNGWTESNAWCMEKGGYLVSIHSREEQDFLTYYVSTYTSYNSHWIGIREYGTDGIYVWSDGTALDFENWNSGEPNDFNGEEQCGEMYGSDGIWNDLNCGNPITFICKRPNGQINPVTYPITPAPTGYCMEGWHQWRHTCYKIFGENQEEQLSWYDSRDTCRNMGGELVIIHDKEIQSFLNTLLKGLRFRMFIGLSDTINNELFIWTDGSFVDFTNWAKNEPNDDGDDGEDCVQMMPDDEVLGQWNDIRCENPNGYICQINISPANRETTVENNCINGYSQYDDACFKVIPGPMTFADAGSACQDDGYQLASINDIFQEAYVETLMFANGAPVWLGMIDDQVAGEYKWVDGWPIWYTNWGPDEPSRGIGEGCVAMMEDGFWYDTRCADSYAAVCKYTSRTKPTSEPSTPGSCPDEWIEYGSDCLLIKSSVLDRSSWPEASYVCAAYGGTLASIHSRYENELILSKVGLTTEDGDIWIGMTREAEGEFAWVDNSPLNYANWAPGEPSYNAGESSEECVEMFPESGTWNDRDCLQKQGYVCKAAKSVLNPSLTTKKRPVNTNPPVEPTSKQSQPNPEKQTGIQTGGIVGLVLGLLAAVCIVVFIVFFLYKPNLSLSGTSKKNSDSKPDFPQSVGFDNALYTAGSENKGDTLHIGMDPAVAEA